MGKEVFWELYAEAIEKAKMLTDDRMPGYVGSGAITDYWINGIDDLIYEINKKNLRLKRQIAADKQAKTADKIDDTLLDLINYAAFAFAFLKLCRTDGLPAIDINCGKDNEEVRRPEYP